MRATAGLILFVLASIASADFPSEKALEQFCKDDLQRIHTPSAAIAVVKDGRVVFAKGFGLVDQQNEVKSTPHHVYRLGSVTKQFTATMIMQLVAEKKLAVDDPARKYLPELPEAWAGVTVRHLLTHTSGIKSYTEIPGLFAGDAMKPVKPLGIVKKVFDIPLGFEPGSQFHYNNTGYEVLGLLIEKLDGHPYADSLKERILKPLRMSETYFTSESSIVKNRAVGYTWTGKEYLNAPYLNMDWPYAAGSIESTVLDLAKWDAALYGDRILSQDLLRQMWSPTTLTDGKTSPYGFGWGVGSIKGNAIVEHGGGIHGFVSEIRRAPGKKLTTIVLMNCDVADAGGLADRLMRFIDPDLKPDEPKPVVDTDPKTTAMLKAFFEGLIKGKADESLLGSEMRKLFTPEMIADAQKQLTSLGKLEKFELVSEREDPKGKRLGYNVTLGGHVLHAVFLVTPKGIIEEAGIRP